MAVLISENYLIKLKLFPKNRRADRQDAGIHIGRL